MKNSTNVVSLKKWRFNKKYGKMIENNKKFIPLIIIPMILASIFMMDKFIVNFLLPKKGIENGKGYRSSIELTVDKEFNRKNKIKQIIV